MIDSVKHVRRDIFIRTQPAQIYQRNPTINVNWITLFERGNAQFCMRKKGAITFQLVPLWYLAI